METQAANAPRSAQQHAPRGSLVQFAIYLLVRTILCVVQTLTLAQCDSLSRILGFVFARVLRIRRAVVDENLRLALPELAAAERRKIADAMWHHLFLLICEVAQGRRKIHDTNWRDHVTLHNAEMIVSRFLSSRALVIVTAHFGNFEMSGHMAGLFGFPTFTIARPLDNPYLDHLLRKFREGTGQRLFPTQGTAELAQAVLESGGALAMLGDHHAGKKGCWVEFFHRPASCHKSIALFPLANNLPLLILLTRRSASPLHFVIDSRAVWDPEAEESRALRSVPELTRWYNQELEVAIREHPEQYWWIHRRWKNSERSTARGASNTAA